MKEVSLDAEPYGEAQYVVTSCFARQTGSASAFLPLIYWDAEQNFVTSYFAGQFVPFSQERGFFG